MSNDYSSLFDYLHGGLPQIPKRKVFISFHHKNDQKWFEHFVSKFSYLYETFYDNSIGETQIRSDDPEYINRAIREDYINGSSITLVLCGAETHKRKYVDWEIHSTLHHQHALMGIVLPTALRTFDGKSIVPNRLHLNVQSGYAHFIEWTDDANLLKQHIELALSKGQNTRLIDNSLEKMARNRI